MQPSSSTTKLDLRSLSRCFQEITLRIKKGLTMTRLVTVALLLLSVASSSEAFAPASMGSTFVQTSTPTRIAFVSPYNIAPRNTNMALQMNLLDRFTRVAKANINNVLKSLEDPEKILTQALEDMQVGSFAVNSIKLTFVGGNAGTILHVLNNALTTTPLPPVLTDRFSQNPPILCRNYRDATSPPQTEGAVRCVGARLVPACPTRAPKGERSTCQGSVDPSTAAARCRH